MSDTDETTGEPEPEGGPDKRNQAFLDQRLAAPHPPETGSDASRGTDESESPLPPDYRRRVIEEYRRRQEAQEEAPTSRTDEQQQLEESDAHD